MMQHGLRFSKKEHEDHANVWKREDVKELKHTLKSVEGLMIMNAVVGLFRFFAFGVPSSSSRTH